MTAAPIEMTGVTDRLAASFAMRRAAFLFVDVQADYFDRQRLRVRGASEQACAHLPVVASRIKRFTRAARRQAGALSAIFAVHMHNRQLERCDADGLRSEIVVPLADDDIVLPKKNFCAFYHTDLSYRLNRRNVDTLVVAGGILEHCVSTTVATAARDFQMNVVVMPDLTASYHHTDDAGVFDAALAGVPRAHLSLVPSCDVLPLLPRMP